MAHKHTVRDTNAHFTIDQFTRQVKNDSAEKTTIVQYDHNSERLTFEMPLYVDGHAMTLCNLIELHFINVSADGKTQHPGTYEVTDIKAEGDKAIFTWLISQEATQLVGSLNFLIVFKCVEDGVTTYRWSTEIFKNLSVSDGMDNGEAVLTEYPDILAQWKTQLFDASNTAVSNVATAEAKALAAIEEAGEAKKRSVLDSIPDEYEELTQNVGTNTAKIRELASGIKGNLSGAVVRADDVSMIEHYPVVKVFGKNLIPYPYEQTEKTAGGGTLVALPDGGVRGSGIPTEFVGLNLCHNVLVKKDEVVTMSSGGNEDGLSVQFTLTTTNGDSIKSFSLTSGEFATYIAKEDTLVGVLVKRASNGVEMTGTIYAQLELGEVATEYTPYIDPSTVTVKRCGKNLISYPYMYGNKEHNGVEFTVFDNGVINMDGTSTDYAVFYVDSESIEFENGVAYDIVQPITKKAGLVLNYTDENGKSSWISSSIVWKSGYTYKGLYIQIDPNVTITENFVPIVKRASDPLDSYTPGADGVVHGVTSVSPTMTIMTDTPGVTVECEYIVDTKTYIDNKIAEALKGSEQA